MNSLVLSILVTAGCQLGPPFEFEQDFRGGVPNPEFLTTIGHGQGGEVVSRPEGLLLRTLPESGQGEPVGLRLRPRVSGDFEATISYALDQVERPASGLGSGVILEARVASRTEDALTAERLNLPDGATHIGSTHIVSDEWGRRNGLPVRAEASSDAGMLRLSRKGSVVEAAFAGLDGEFHTLQQVEIGEGDLVDLRLVCTTGQAKDRVSAWLTGFQMRADRVATSENLSSTGMTMGARDRILCAGLIQLVLLLLFVAGVKTSSVEGNETTTSQN